MKTAIAKNFFAVNPCKDYKRFVLSFGAYGDTLLLVWADHLEDALDEAIDWIVENAPGLLADKQVQEAFDAAVARGLSNDAAAEDATADMTCGGNCGNFIPSWEWQVVSTYPSRERLKSIISERGAA
jgi:hypothetical protein